MCDAYISALTDPLLLGRLLDFVDYFDFTQGGVPSTFYSIAVKDPHGLVAPKLAFPVGAEQPLVLPLLTVFAIFGLHNRLRIGFIRIATLPLSRSLSHEPMKDFRQRYKFS